MKRWLLNKWINVKIRHEQLKPDFIVGSSDNPYLYRWYITPWRRWLRRAEENPTLWNKLKGWASVVLPNIYLHKFMRDDDDSALHDHPWFWCSYIIENSYIEHTIAAGGIHKRRHRLPGSLAVSHPWRAHRVELVPRLERFVGADGEVVSYAMSHGIKSPCWTIFITWLRLREWGFHCPERGWVHWKEFTQELPGQNINKGCGDDAIRVRV